MAKHQRILLKLSGEVLAGGASFGIDAERVLALASDIAEVARTGVQLGLVVGGGNFFRGVAAAARNLDRSEEHTSELQSQFHLVCRLLLEKKKRIISTFGFRPSCADTSNTLSQDLNTIIPPPTLY